MRISTLGLSLAGSLCLLAVACTQETDTPGPDTNGGTGGGTSAGGTAGTAGTGTGGTPAGGTGGTAGTGGAGGTTGGTGGLGSGGLGGGGTGGGLGGGGTGGLGGTAGGGAGGTAGGGAGGGGTTVMFSAVSGMLNTTCGVSTCHGTGIGAHMPTLTNTNPQMLHTSLTTFMVPECQNKPLVDPGDPANSAILALVQKECGNLYMPATCSPQADSCIPQADIDTLTDWIEGGAPGPQ